VKILLVHNFYGTSAPSGENTAYSAEAGLLRTRGHSVVEFNRRSDEILQQGFYGTLKGAASAVWNPFSVSRLRGILQETRPDVMHVHNTFPLLSPAVFYASQELNVPTVMTMHNYRVGCSAGTALRDEQPCTLCLDKKSVLPAIRYGCYRNSRMATLPISMMIAFHNARDTWRRNVDAFVTLTGFQREKMIRFGIPEALLHVKPNFLEHPPQPVPWSERTGNAVFVGRLYAAKGIHVLVHAWTGMGSSAPRLEIIGDGPMRGALEDSVRRSGAAPSVKFLGNASHDEALKYISNAKLLIVPSICFEGFPMVIQEAFALGVPVAASNIGSLPYLIAENKNGRLFSSGNPEALRSCVMKLLDDDAALRLLGVGAKSDFEEHYTAEKNHSLLMAVYKAAAEHRKTKGR
jgi:glycosyltransferase involved in cell wall biosynthesis